MRRRGTTLVMVGGLPLGCCHEHSWVLDINLTGTPRTILVHSHFHHYLPVMMMITATTMMMMMVMMMMTWIMIMMTTTMVMMR